MLPHKDLVALFQTNPASPLAAKQLSDDAGARIHADRHVSQWPGRLVFAGVKNIHAYSWLAHSRKYLESVEREKRHSHAVKVP